MSYRAWHSSVVKSFRVAYPTPWWFGFSILPTIVLAPVLVVHGFSDIPEQPAPLYYLLGAQAETLGTIFVLAFTFSLVAAQVAARYSHLLFHRILGSWALWYACPFGAGIILPLFLLHGQFFLWSVQISLLIAVYCIVSLLPFAVAVRGLLSISGAITEKKNQISDAKSDKEICDRIRDLSEIAVGALSLKDYQVFALGVRELADLARTSVEKDTLPILIGNETLKMLSRTADDRFASETLLDTMVEIGIKQPTESELVANGEMMNLVLEAQRSANIAKFRSYSEGIRVIGQCARNGISKLRPTVTKASLTILYTITERSISELPTISETPQQAVRMLGEITQATLASSLALNDHDELISLSIAQIEAIGTKAGAANRPEIKDLSKVQFRRLLNDNSSNGLRMRGRAQAAMSVLCQE